MMLYHSVMMMVVKVIRLSHLFDDCALTFSRRGDARENVGASGMMLYHFVIEATSKSKSIASETSYLIGVSEWEATSKSKASLCFPNCKEITTFSNEFLSQKNIQ